MTAPLDGHAQAGIVANQNDSTDSRASLRVPCCGNGAPGYWCVAHTEPQAEHWANDNLQRLGYTTFLPLIATYRRNHVTHRRTVLTLAPLFSRYLFVANDNANAWRPIREAPGVQNVITIAGKAQYARAGAVEALQALEHTRRQLPARRTVGAVGDAVAVRYGIVAGHRGVITSVSRDTAHIALLFLGQLRDVRLPLDCLSPVAVE